MLHRCLSSDFQILAVCPECEFLNRSKRLGRHLLNCAFSQGTLLQKFLQILSVNEQKGKQRLPDVAKYSLEILPEMNDAALKLQFSHFCSQVLFMQAGKGKWDTRKSLGRQEKSGMPGKVCRILQGYPRTGTARGTHPKPHKVEAEPFHGLHRQLGDEKQELEVARQDQKLL